MKAPKHVVVHPIVLLSVVDHFNRLSRIGNQRRVVGVLLGSWRSGVVDVATSFAGMLYIMLYTSYKYTLEVVYIHVHVRAPDPIPFVYVHMEIW